MIAAHPTGTGPAAAGGVNNNPDWSPRLTRQEIDQLDRIVEWSALQKTKRTNDGKCIDQHNKTGNTNCRCVTSFLDRYRKDYSQDINWMEVLVGGAKLKSFLDTDHREYYSEETVTDAEFCRLDKMLASVFCRHFTPNVKKNNYWSVMDESGNDLFNFCNTGLAELMGGKMVETNREGALALMNKYGFVLLKAPKSASSDGKETYLRFNDSEKESDSFVSLFSGETAHRPVAKKPRTRGPKGKSALAVTPWGAFYCRQVNQNMSMIPASGMLEIRRREDPEDVTTVDPTAQYLMVHRSVHVNHAAVRIFEEDMRQKRPDKALWDLKTEAGDIDNPIDIYEDCRGGKVAKNTPRKKKNDQDAWKNDAFNGQVFASSSSYKCAIGPFRTGLEDTSGDYKNVLIISHDATYANRPVPEPAHHSVVRFQGSRGKLVDMTRFENWVAPGKMSYETYKDEECVTEEAIGKVRHFGYLSALGLDKKMLREVKHRVLDAVGPDFCKEFLGEGSAATGGFARETVRMCATPGFQYFVEYRARKPFVVPGVAGGVADEATDGGYDNGKTLRNLFQELGYAPGVPKNNAKLADVDKLQEQLEGFACWTSTAGKVGGDHDDPNLDKYVATLHHPRICGVQDYRSEDNLVVQLPGLPFPDRDVRAFKAGKKEAYEVVVPLDEQGLLVWMIPRRPAVKVGRPAANAGAEGGKATATDDQENNIQGHDNDDKTILFVRFGTALLIPATVHYSTFHRSSMTGSPHLKAIISVKLKSNEGDTRPLIMKMPLLGNVAAGCTLPVGLKLSSYDHKFVPGKHKKNLQDIFALQHEHINGPYSCHLTRSFMLLFATYCLPARSLDPDPRYNTPQMQAVTGGGGGTGAGDDGPPNNGNQDGNQGPDQGQGDQGRGDERDEEETSSDSTGRT
jgi:hypothetical protein